MEPCVEKDKYVPMQIKKQIKKKFLLLNLGSLNTAAIRDKGSININNKSTGDICTYP